MKCYKCDAFALIVYGFRIDAFNARYLCSTCAKAWEAIRMSDASFTMDQWVSGHGTATPENPEEVDPSKCTCPREVWLFHGCKCGAMKREKEKNSDDK